MSYLGVLFMIVVTPILMGFALAKRRRLSGREMWRTVIISAVVMVLWVGVSWVAREYAETEKSEWLVAEWWAQRGKWFVFAGFTLLFLSLGAGLEEVSGRRGRVVVCGGAVLMVVWVTVWRTIPIYTFIPRETTRDDNGFIRQTMRNTCGPVSLGNFIEQCCGERKVTEREITRLAGTTYEGTTVGGLMRAAIKMDLEVVACRKIGIEELEETGRQGIVSVYANPGLRHASLLIGFDGDSVCFIDPDRGYWEISRELFSEIWYGKTLVLGCKRVRKLSGIE